MVPNFSWRSKCDNSGVFVNFAKMAHNELIEKKCFLSIYILIFKIGWESIQRPRILWLRVWKTFCQFAADCPTLAIVVRPVLKVRPRDRDEYFDLKNSYILKRILDYLYSKFHFISTNIWLFVRKSLQRAPWRLGCGGHTFLLLWVDCVVAVAASGSNLPAVLSAEWLILLKNMVSRDVKRVLDNLVTMLCLSCIYWS